MPQNFLRILIVEDDEKLRESLSVVLSAAGHTVAVSADGSNARQRVMLERYDLVISDIRLPNKLSGIDLLVYIKQHKPLPVILMTGFSALSEIEKADRMRADGFLEKPFKPEELLRLISALFGGDPEPVAELDLDKQFSQLGIDDFVMGKQVQFDVYLRLSKSKYVKLVHRGEEINRDRIIRMREKGVRHLFLASDDFQRYLELNLSLSAAVRGNRQVSGEKKASLLRHTAEVFLERIHREEIDEESFSTAKKVAENSVAFLAEYAETFNLLAALNAHSDALYAHSLGVSMYASMIAREMGWTAFATQQRISTIGLLHDIGKKEIPKELLVKPHNDRTPEEIALFETHSFRGAQILTRIGASEDMVQAVLQHHENCVGGGYPSHYRKNKIIPIARLLSVADEFCYLAIKNSEGPALPPAEAMRRLLCLNREALDPVFVNALGKALKLKVETPET
ncbi:MAG: HD domain-containing phosphohydrolase [Bdellovibrionota bacterium]